MAAGSVRCLARNLPDRTAVVEHNVSAREYREHNPEDTGADKSMSNSAAKDQVAHRHRSAGCACNRQDTSADRH